MNHTEGEILRIGGWTPPSPPTKKKVPLFKVNQRDLIFNLQLYEDTINILICCAFLICISWHYMSETPVELDALCWLIICIKWYVNTKLQMTLSCSTKIAASKSKGSWVANHFIVRIRIMSYWPTIGQSKCILACLW